MERLEDDNFRTVECLRGRLLAERVASRAAKEEAELMTKRLMELERLLAMEIKGKNKAEKRLKWALKKLESLRLVEDGRDLWASSEEFLGGRLEISSPTCSSGSLMHEEERGKQHLKDPKERSDGRETEEEGFAMFSGGSAWHSVSENDSWRSVGTAHSVNGGNASSCGGSTQSKSNYGLKALIADTARQFSASSVEHEDRASLDDYVNDDSLALVPGNMWGDFGKEEQTTVEKRDSLNAQPETNCIGSLSSSSRPQISSNVHDVLLALQHAKEQLQNSSYHRAILSKGALL